MTKRPFVLVSPSIEKRGVEFNDLSISLSLRYEQAVLAAGGIPVIGPATTDPAVLAEAVRRCEGVLLTGGDDISPGLYDPKLPKRILKTVGPTPDGGGRDLCELLLIAEIFRQRKPVLAICRGHQLLNVAFGGQLVADIRQQVPGALNHQQMDKACELVHEVTLTPGSLLAKICGRQVLGVNSTHHQAVLAPAEPFVAVARSSDGLVEAMELRPELAGKPPFLLSVQFHPERLTQVGDCYSVIFRKFILYCSRNRNTKNER